MALEQDIKSGTILQRIARSLEQEPGDRSKPKYVVLHNSLLAAIEAGEWLPGEKLPAEAAFAQEMPVSLGTVQKALQVLAEEGVVERRHRDGTYVTGNAINDEISILRFHDAGDDSLLPIYTNVLDISRTRETGPWSIYMPDEDSFVRISRLISVNLNFKVYNRVHLPASRFESFLNRSTQDLDGVAVIHILGTQFNAPMLRAIQRLRIVDLPAPICAVIGVAPGTTGMKLDVQALSYRDQPIAHHQNYVPPNNCQLEILEPRR